MGTIGLLFSFTRSIRAIRPYDVKHASDISRSASEKGGETERERESVSALMPVESVGLETRVSDVSVLVFSVRRLESHNMIIIID